jgi:hypothetical protein
LRRVKTASLYCRVLKPTLNGNKFSFKLKTVGGVSYQFDETFSRMDFSNVETQPQGQVVLSGVLKKKSGKIVAQSMDFYRELCD